MVMVTKMMPIYTATGCSFITISPCTVLDTCIAQICIEQKCATVVREKSGNSVVENQ